MWKILASTKLLAVGAVAGIAMISTPQQAHAGCHINLHVINLEHNAKIVVSPGASKVRTKNGTWRLLTKGGWSPSDPEIQARQSAGDVYKAAMNCNRKRQFRISYVCKAPDKPPVQRVHYYPPSSYVKGKNFKLGLACR